MASWGAVGGDHMITVQPGSISATAIQDIVDRIVTRFSPRKVILFGSYANGAPDRDSDIDLLVIMDTSLRPVDQAVEIRQFVRAPFPFDLLVRTPEQVQERLDLGDDFFRDVTETGLVVYEASDD